MRSMENKKHETQELKEHVLGEVETYAKAEYEVARLRVIEKVGHLVGSLLLTICLILIAFAVLTFCAAAAVFALAEYLPAWAACLIVGGVYLLLIPVLAACSKVLFINPIVRKLSGLKNVEELAMETVRAEGRAAVQRERITSKVRLAQTIYRHYTQLAQTAIQTIRSLFHKEA